MKKKPLSKVLSSTVLLLLLTLFVHAQTIPVSGKLTGKDGEPLAGATVTVKGTTQTAVTKADGTFQLNVPSEDAVLMFTYVGFDSQEMKVGSLRAFNVSLTPAGGSLNDVVVVGYGTRKKSDVTGAVASIGSDEIKKRPVQNALQAMQGKVAGVDITSNERPGELGAIMIRGARSINATQNPLYVVDGIPMPIEGGPGLGLGGLNPQDIETIDILKDASATAIYGSRGANGVVLITTKQGKKGKLSLNYIGNLTVENQHDRQKMMNSDQYIDFRRNAYRRINYLNSLNGVSTPANTGYSDPNNPNYADDQRIFAGDPYALANVNKGWVNGAWDGSRVPSTDWTDYALRTGITQDHTIIASGGTDKMKTLASVGYLNQTGTIKGQDFKRYNAKFTTELKPVKWFTIGGSINGTYSIQNYGFQTNNATGPGNMYFALRDMLPYAIPYDTLGKRINLPGGDINILNPVDENKYAINERKVFRVMGSFYAEAEIMKGLKYRLQFGPDLYNLRNGQYLDALSINRGAGQSGSTNQASLNQANRISWTLDNLIYYDKSFGEHNVNVTLLQTASRFRNETSSMTAVNLPWTSQKWNQLGSVSALTGFGTDLIESQLTSYMARVNYGFSNKYLLTLSGRWDGASMLADGNKWDFFPAASLAWRLDQEDFIKNVNWLDQLKLRVGYGTTGNSSVDAYATKGRLQTLYYTWGSVVAPGYVPSDPSSANPVPLADQNLGWEKTNQINVGIDFGILKNRLSGTIDLYSSRTNRLLYKQEIPVTNGYTQSWSNVASSSNYGVDLTLNSTNIKTRDFSWNSSLSLTVSREKVTRLSNGKQDDIANGFFINQRITTYYDYDKKGIWQNTPEDLAEIAKFAANGNIFRPGDIRVVDQNGDYKIDPNNDRVFRGHRLPNWSGGLSNSFSYKNWDLSFFIFARMGFTVVTGAESLQGRFAQRQLDYWTPSNPTNGYSSPNYNSAAGDTYKSAMNYQDGSFIKLRNVSLGYTVPSQVAQKMHMTNFKIYAQATNPGLIYSKIKWIDPDLGGSTFNRGFVLGVNVGF